MCILKERTIPTTRSSHTVNCFIHLSLIGETPVKILKKKTGPGNTNKTQFVQILTTEPNVSYYFPPVPFY